MKQNIIITSVIAILALVSCVTGPKTVEFPLVETPATTSIIIEKVELTDTVTSLHISGYHRLGWWIRIVSETHLLADGKKYEMTGADGIIPDDYLWMPSDGDSLFVLKFSPLPLRTKSFDFIEGYEEGAFRLRLPHKHLNMDLYPGVPDHHCINSHYCHNPQLLCRL